MKGLWAKKHARMKKNPLDSERKKQIESGAAQTLDCGSDARKTESGNLNQVNISFIYLFLLLLE